MMAVPMRECQACGVTQPTGSYRCPGCEARWDLDEQRLTYQQLRRRNGLWGVAVAVALIAGLAFLVVR